MSRTEQALWLMTFVAIAELIAIAYLLGKYS